VPGDLERKATVCGRVQARLLDVDPASVGVEVSPPEGPEEPAPPWDLGPLRCGIAVWDGPDVRVRDDRGDADGIGLIDFGHTGWSLTR
jgi:hypothetical protein